MSAVAMKTHDYIKDLVKKGFTEGQVEAIARHQTELIDENLVTQKDLEWMKKDLVLKLGGLIVGGWVATMGVILGLLPMMLR